MRNSMSPIPRIIKEILLMELFMFVVYNLMMTALQSFAQFLTGDATTLAISFGIFTLFDVSFRLFAGQILVA